MTKKEVVELLRHKHQALYDWLDNHPNQNWVIGPKGKWNTGEHVVHLIQSENALNKALWLPKFYMKYKFGTNNRDNRSYDEIVAKYQHKLANHPGVVADISKKMPAITLSNKDSFISILKREESILIEKIQKWTECDLDKYLLPHPLMGRMTIREIAIWTAYHTGHHNEILKKNY